MQKLDSADPNKAQQAALSNHRKELLRLVTKAEEFLVSLGIELGVQISAEQSRNLQLALLQDFIEVHNGALEHAVELELPEDKPTIDRLLANGNGTRKK